jgi:hypothetical protein
VVIVKCGILVRGVYVVNDAGNQSSTERRIFMLILPTHSHAPASAET